MRGDGLLGRSLDLARATAEGVDVMTDALEVLDRFVGADTLSLSAMRTGDSIAADVTLRGADPMSPAEFEHWPRLMPTHPYFPFLISGPITTSRLTDVVDIATFERTELYRRLLHPRGSRFQAALLLRRSPGSMLLLSLWRAERDFDDVEVAALEACRAVLSAAITYADAVAAARGALAALTRDDRDTDAPETGSEAGHEELTARQRQVLVLLAQGRTNDQIARRLGISSRTVRKHVADIFERTGARSRTEVAGRWQGGR